MFLHASQSHFPSNITQKLAKLLAIKEKEKNEELKKKKLFLTKRVGEQIREVGKKRLS